MRGAYIPYPTFFAAKLASTFAEAGDTIVRVSSGDPLLSAYGCLKRNGHLALLVVNKSPDTDFRARFAVRGFKPGGSGRIYSYGKTQDDAQSKGAVVDLATEPLSGIGRSFERVFPSYSISVLDLE